MFRLGGVVKALIRMQEAVGVPLGSSGKVVGGCGWLIYVRWDDGIVRAHHPDMLVRMS